MTREEAIEVIKAYRDKLTNSASNQLDGDIEAFEMAIQVLSQEPYRSVLMSLQYRTLENGTPIPDNATNGDVIKAMFGEVAYLLIKKTMGKYDWWNAPYQKGGKG